jgi:hypothetical protein
MTDVLYLTVHFQVGLVHICTVGKMNDFRTNVVVICFRILSQNFLR